VRVPVDDFKGLNDIFCCGKLVVVYTVSNMVLGGVCSLREDVEDFVIFVVEAATVHLEFYFDIGFLGVEVDFTFFVTCEPIRVVELSSVFEANDFTS
jgi:hypothetical protein